MTISVIVGIAKIYTVHQTTLLATHSGTVLVASVAPAVPSTLLRGSVRTCPHQLLMTLSYVSVWTRLLTMKTYSLKQWSSMFSEPLVCRDYIASLNSVCVCVCV